MIFAAWSSSWFFGLWNSWSANGQLGTLHHQAHQYPAIGLANVIPKTLFLHVLFWIFPSILHHLDAGTMLGVSTFRDHGETTSCLFTFKPQGFARMTSPWMRPGNTPNPKSISTANSLGSSFSSCPSDAKGICSLSLAGQSRMAKNLI